VGEFLNETYNLKRVRNDGESLRTKILKLAWSLIMFGLAASPVVAALLVYAGSPCSVVMTSYVFYKPSANHTKIVQATTLNKFDKIIFGTTKDLLHMVTRMTKVFLKFATKKVKEFFLPTTKCPLLRPFR
jgi:hypothetical protein